MFSFSPGICITIAPCKSHRNPIVSKQNYKNTFISNLSSVEPFHIKKASKEPDRLSAGLSIRCIIKNGPRSLKHRLWRNSEVALLSWIPLSYWLAGLFAFAYPTKRRKIYILGYYYCWRCCFVVLLSLFIITLVHFYIRIKTWFAKHAHSSYPSFPLPSDSLSHELAASVLQSNVSAPH